MVRQTLWLLLVLAVLPGGCSAPAGRAGSPPPLRPLPAAEGPRGPYRPAPPPGAAAGGLIDTGEPRPLGAIDPSVRRESPRLQAPATCPARPPLADGDQVVSRLGRVRRAEGTSGRVFVFNPPAAGQQALPTMEILPSGMLDAIEQAIAEAGEAELLFHITGEVTRYHGRWYLLIRKALVERPAAVPAGGDSQSQP